MVFTVVRQCAALVLGLSVWTPAVAHILMPADPVTVAMARMPDSGSGSEQADATEQVVVRHCRVTSIHDGDSMRVRCPGFRNTLRVRLDQIDAPEVDQTYGTQSRDFLRLMCPIGGDVMVHDLGTDTYNRRLGRIYCNNIDVNAAMVESGSAWVYDYHATDQNLYALQEQARNARRGLWAARKTPVPPWDFRHQQRRQRGQ